MKYTTMIAATALLSFVGATALADDAKPVHLIILSGQSNMVGMNPKTGLEPEAAKLFSGGAVVQFKVASGGKPIRLWLDNWNEIAKRSGIDAAEVRKKEKNAKTVYYQPILQKYRETVAKHGKPATVTFCWMQGERDAREGLSAAYGESLKQLIGQLRKDLQRPDMGFVIGRLSDFGKADHKHWHAIRKIQVEVAKADPKGAWVDCDDLNDKKRKDGSLNNDLHYTKDGYTLLGRRFARQAKLIIDGKTPAADGRPK